MGDSMGESIVSMVKALLMVLTISSCLLFAMSTIWMRLNEFNEKGFPKIKVFSMKVLMASASLLAIVQVASMIEFRREAEKEKYNFIDAYQDYQKFASNPIKLTNDIEAQIELLLNSGTTYGRYKASVLKADDELSMSLNLLRSGNKDELIRVFGTSDIEVNDVFARRDLIDMTDEEMRQAANSGVYSVELYYTDTNAREAAESKYRQKIQENYPGMNESEQEGLLVSYMTQYDTDRLFDVSKEVEFTLDDENKVVLSDEAKAFILKEDSSGELDGPEQEVGA